VLNSGCVGVRVYLSASALSLPVRRAGLHWRIVSLDPMPSSLSTVARTTVVRLARGITVGSERCYWMSIPVHANKDLTMGIVWGSERVEVSGSDGLLLLLM